MNADHYQQCVLRTANTDLQYPFPLLNWGLGLCGEAGEVAELVKKHVFHGHAFDRDKMKKELGDVAWYLAAAAHESGFNLSEVLTANVEKLRQRFPEGFTSQASIDRKDV